MEAWATEDALSRIELAFADAPLPTAVFTAHGSLLYANTALQRMLAGEWGIALSETLQRQLARVPTRTWEVEQSLHVLGEHLHLRFAFARSRHDAGDQIVVQVIDVTDARMREAALLRLSEREPLTDLWNRRRFEAELGRELERARRAGLVGATLVVLDVDGLKQVNDRLGHQSGDQVIRHVATTLSGRLRVSDSLARIGGDEFAILLVNACGTTAQTVVDDLCAAVSGGKVPVGEERLTLSISAGYVDVSPAALDAEALFAMADKALYRAKAGDRGCAVRAA